MFTDDPELPEIETKTLLPSTASFDFLTKLPGIGSLQQAKMIMKGAGSLRELFVMPKNQLNTLLGTDDLYNFLHFKNADDS